ncbi:unnamed protein product [Hermetia illucens]|uniref:Small integral membrane protein 14 n=1 Tax=Hermetia illucens TaxID=343691 RepID=A0A7R8UAI5_HERIL|nr:small integral membrane protein 14 [Hermetia illucens]XP_037924339.1 small integral membrane protein 14 [Hermetia illucens]CAD7077166.1 unnamed protein product [Hermetia illucens]
MPEEFDGCECVWSHELAMRRLLSLIRQGQAHCTDSECTDVVLPRPNNDAGENFTFMSMFFLIAVILYFIRPSAFMRPQNGTEKPQQPPPGGEGPNNGAPPTIN